MIQGIELTKLQNPEFLQFNRNVLKLIYDNGKDALKVVVQYDKLEAIINAIANMFKEDTGSDITNEIAALDIRRDEAITGITLFADALTRHHIVATRNNATLILNEINLYGPGIARQTMQNETATIDSIVTKLTTDTKLMAAVAALPLVGAWITELKTANDLFNDKYLARTVEMGAANPDTIRAKRLEAYQAYYKLRDMLVSYYNITDGDALYTTTINSINALIDQYNLVITQREADALRARTNDTPTPPIN